MWRLEIRLNRSVPDLEVTIHGRSHDRPIHSTNDYGCEVEDTKETNDHGFRVFGKDISTEISTANAPPLSAIPYPNPGGTDVILLCTPTIGKLEEGTSD